MVKEYSQANNLASIICLNQLGKTWTIRPTKHISNILKRVRLVKGFNNFVNEYLKRSSVIFSRSKQAHGQPRLDNASTLTGTHDNHRIQSCVLLES